MFHGLIEIGPGPVTWRQHVHYSTVESAVKSCFVYLHVPDHESSKVKLHQRVLVLLYSAEYLAVG